MDNLTHDTTAPILNDVARVIAKFEVESKGREVGRWVVGVWQLVGD